MSSFGQIPSDLRPDHILPTTPRKPAVLQLQKPKSIQFVKQAPLLERNVDFLKLGEYF